VKRDVTQTPGPFRVLCTWHCPAYRYTSVKEGFGKLGRSERTDDDAAVVIANIAYSRKVVADTVNRLRLEEPWASDPIVKRLGAARGARIFTLPSASVGYITRLLKRLSLRRRRVTNTMKKRPSDEAIRAHQVEMQARLRGVPPQAIVSGDETAWCWGIKPRYQYVATSGSDGRGAVPDSDEKQR
jgi:hypothetical protein